MTALQTAHLEKKTLSPRFLLTHLYQADQQAPRLPTDAQIVDFFWFFLQKSDEKYDISFKLKIYPTFFSSEA